ncbi:MAG: hypothetical protein ACF8QF_05520 [Phycisphaerales bacterium]
MPRRPRSARLLVLALLPAGCSAPVGVGLDSPDPQGRTIALARLSGAPAESDIPELIQSLTSADPAQRLLAINTLERMTGETFGYRHYDPDWRRREAVARWQAWWLEREGEAMATGGALP